MNQQTGMGLRTRHKDYNSISSEPIEMSTKAGTVVRMLFPPNPEGALSEHPFKTAEQIVVEKSMCTVGLALQNGAKIVDTKGVPVPEVEMVVMRTKRGSTFKAKVFDPGKEYDVCFLVNSAPHSALVHKVPASSNLQ